MKTTLSFLFALILLSAQTGFSQADTNRRADKPKFFITSLSGLDKGSGRDEAFDTLGGLCLCRYVNLLPQVSALSLNGEWRNGWDVDSSEYNHITIAIPDSIVIGGPSASLLDVIMYDPTQLDNSLQDARILRFETERHSPSYTLSDTLTDYCGFYAIDSLVGNNVLDDSATSPRFLIGTTRETDSNAVRLIHGTDSAGVFESSYWFDHFLQGLGQLQYLWLRSYGRGLIARFRVKVDSTVDTTVHDSLFRVVIEQGNPSITVLDTAVQIDEWIRHANSGYDTISLRFRSDKTADTLTKFTLSWQGKVSMTMDYMEILTARLDSMDYINGLQESGNVDHGGSRTPNLSYEELEENGEAKLTELIHKLMDFKGKIQYIMTREEFGFEDYRIFKRAAKLLRDSSGGEMELVTSLHDTTEQNKEGGSFYGMGLPNMFLYLSEGVKRGWLDSAYYADPKMFIVGQSAWGASVPLPKRTTDTGTALNTWQYQHVNEALPCAMDSMWGVTLYNKNLYMQLAQNAVVSPMVNKFRMAKRVSLRNDDNVRFADFIQAGAGIALETNYQCDTPYKNMDTALCYTSGLRAITAPELKVQCHLATSCGATGLILYTLVTNDGISTSNGGIMDDKGRHSEQLHTFTIKDSIDAAHVTTRSRLMFTGWKENYDSAKTSLPIIQKYGRVLINAHYVGDWLAAELFLAPDSVKAELPFLDTSIRTLDDSGRLDAYKPTLNFDDTVNFSNNLPKFVGDTSNRTFVHISLWLDNDSTAKALHQDTLLYITNTRTDDSYSDTAFVPTTIDRRLITIQLKAKHLVQDIADTTGYLALDNRKIWTPYVGAGDSLRVLLLAGDGILVRLLPPPDSTKQMRVGINYPKGGNDFNSYGRINFDKPVKGVLDPTNSAKFNVPSSPYSYIGIKDGDTVKMWQDSLAYIKIDNVDQSRKAYWRNQNWTAFDNSVGFNFRNTVFPASNRTSQISTDSIAHQIVIKTDLEGQSSTGVIGVRDPFLVDSATLNNVLDTLWKSSPFMPHLLNTGRMPGADSQRYGGVFLLQNEAHLSSKPIYSLKAPYILQSGVIPQDTVIANPGDWVFMQWVSNDDVDGSDAMPWQTNPLDNDFNDFPLINSAKNPDVVFVRDSAQYIARYKAHMASFTNGSDSGFLWNNQRKLYFINRDPNGDPNGTKWYQMVYSSAGRIYTAAGHQTNAASTITWDAEKPVSEWSDNTAQYPAMSLYYDYFARDSTGIHCTDSAIHVVYQRMDMGATSTDIKIGILDNSIDGGGLFTLYGNLNATDTDAGTLEATPVIASDQSDYAGDDGLDVCAWASPHGIMVKAIGNLRGEVPGAGTMRTDGSYNRGPEFRFGDSTARHPTIWVDTCFECDTGHVICLVTLAWQQDTTMIWPHPAPFNRHHIDVTDSTFTDILAVQFDVRYGKLDDGPGKIYFRAHPGKDLRPKDVSFGINQGSWVNINPCISGVRLTTDSELVRLSYESTGYTGGPPSQGIQVAHLKTGVSNWQPTHYFTTGDTTNDKFLKPSIEVMRYNDSAGTGVMVKKHNWYALAFEDSNGTGILHYAMNQGTIRTGPSPFFSISKPQLAAVKESIDDLGNRVGLGGAAQPKLFGTGNTALFKRTGEDSVWYYHFVIENDSEHGVGVQYGTGELSLDDGETLWQLDLLRRSEDETIDSAHASDYFTQSETFTLPASGIFSYFRWIAADSLASDTVKYALDFYDSTGAFVARLDSLVLCDSVSKITGTASVTIDREQSITGHTKFHRVSNLPNVTGGVWQPIITEGRMSVPVSNKQTRKPLSAPTEDIEFTAAPNPSKGDVTVTFSIPVEGYVSIAAYNQLGLEVSKISEFREFHAGEHKLIWHPNSLPAGVYYLQLHYGNLEKVIRVIYLQ